MWTVQCETLFPWIHCHESLAWECQEREKQSKRDEEKTGERRVGWLHPGVILSCPRNFPPNTGKSLSDQQPNSSSASCAEAPHASSRLFPNTTFTIMSRHCLAGLLTNVPSNSGTHNMTQVAVLCCSKVYMWFTQVCSCRYGQIAPSPRKMRWKVSV